MSQIGLLRQLVLAKRNVNLPREKIEKLQNKKLRRLLRHAYRNSKYYYEAFRSAGITEESIDTTPLSAFPTIDKHILLNRFNDIITVPNLTQSALQEFDEATGTDRTPYKNEYHVVHSSGSTGKPGYFIYDNKAWNAMLIGIIRAALWDLSLLQIIKLLAGKPHILYIAATDGHYGGAMAVGDGIDGVGAEQLHLDIKTPLSEWVAKVKDFKPDIVIGYPSAIKILGELTLSGEVQVNISRIISCGEPLGTHMRQYFEKTFAGAKVLNFYGASESLALGVEENSEDGMILFDDMNIIEVQNGQMYLTSLYNLAQPLIRYRLTDDIALQNTDGFTKAIGLIGREEDVLWFENLDGSRDFLHPLSVEGICVEGLRDYQFCKTGNASFEMLAEFSKSADIVQAKSQIRLEIDLILKEKGLDYVSYEIFATDQIAPDPITGKKKLVLPYEEKAKESESA